MSEIDLHLLRLKYEILNVPLETLALEISLPVELLELESKEQAWTQWWPGAVAVVEETAGQVLVNSPDEDDETLLSPLEQGAQTYIRDTQIRLRVFNLAKEVYLSHKYALLESAILDRAKTIAETCVTSLDLRNVAATVRDISFKTGSAQSSFSIGVDDGGLPTVIIKDLSGRNAV